MPKAVTVCAGWYAFAILSALLIAGGRMHTPDNTYTAAKQARYLILPLLTWGVTVSLLVRTSAVRRWRGLSYPVCCCLIGVLLWLSFHKLRWWFQTHSQLFSDDQFAELSIENGLSDPTMMKQIFPDASFINGYLPGLKSAHISIYYRNKGGVIGTALARVAPDAGHQVAGQATHLRRLVSGLEIVGWAQGVADRELFLTDEHEQIIGIGGHLANGLPWGQVSRDISPPLAWVAFVPDKFAHGSFRVFLKDDSPKSSSALPGIYALPPEALDARNTTKEYLGTWFVLGDGSE